MITYFFSQDQDSHWYMIPATLRERWKELQSGDSDDDENNDAIMAEFGAYMTGGGIEKVEFTVVNAR